MRAWEWSVTRTLRDAPIEALQLELTEITRKLTASPAERQQSRTYGGGYYGRKAVVDTDGSPLANKTRAGRQRAAQLGPLPLQEPFPGFDIPVDEAGPSAVGNGADTPPEGELGDSGNAEDRPEFEEGGSGQGHETRAEEGGELGAADANVDGTAEPEAREEDTDDVQDEEVSRRLSFEWLYVPAISPVLSLISGRHNQPQEWQA